MKTPNHQELWRDAINDAAPDTFVEATLASTIAHARRTRRIRHAVRVAAGASVAFIAAWVGALLIPSPQTTAPNDGVSSIKADTAPGVSAPSLTPQAVEPVGISVRYLTDEELLDRFPDQPVGFVGTGSSREFLMLANVDGDESLRGD